VILWHLSVVLSVVKKEKCQMNKPVCVKCSVEMKCAKNGVGVLEWAGEKRERITSADLYECPFCHCKVVTSFARTSTCYNDDGFGRLLEMHRRESTLVNDYEWNDMRVGTESIIKEM